MNVPQAQGRAGSNSWRRSTGSPPVQTSNTNNNTQQNAYNQAQQYVQLQQQQFLQQQQELYTLQQAQMEMQLQRLRMQNMEMQVIKIFMYASESSSLCSVTGTIPCCQLWPVLCSHDCRTSRHSETRFAHVCSPYAHFNSHQKRFAFLFSR